MMNIYLRALKNPPKIEYENVPFPRLPRHKVVGLVTIHPINKITSLLKNAWKYRKGTAFYRRGSNSMPASINFELRNTNKEIVTAIERNARNNIKLTLDSVFDFIDNHKPEYNPQYKVFNEQFVLCWAGKKKTINNEEYYTRVDIELINEQVKLFFSALDDVQISYNNNSFIVTEYIFLGLEQQEKLYPLEKTIINFKNNGKHDIAKEFLFEPPKFDAVIIQHIFNNCNTIINKIEKEIPLSVTEHEDVLRLPINYLICYLHGFLEVAEQLKKAKNYIKNLEDKTTYIKYKEAIRVIRKVKYN